MVVAQILPLGERRRTRVPSRLYDDSPALEAFDFRKSVDRNSVIGLVAVLFLSAGCWGAVTLTVAHLLR
jgi:hypothetical protein